MQEFDPYHRWLGIPAHERPVSLYRLLGISDFETDQEVITEASYRQIGHVKQYASGQHRDAANKILNELAKAQVILLDPAKKMKYDISIQDKQDQVDAPSIRVAASEAPKAPAKSVASKKKSGRRKQSSLPLFIFGGVVLLFVLGTLGYWLNSRPNPDVVSADNRPNKSGTTENNSSKTSGESSETTSPTTDAKPKAEPVVREPITLDGHLDVVESVVLSPDGQRLVSGSSDKTLKLWDAADGEEVKTLTGLSHRVLCLAFAPKGNGVAIGSAEETFRIWDVEKGEELQVFSGHSDSIASVAFSADGQQVVSGSLDNTLKIWDVDSGEELQTLTGHQGKLTSVAFSPSGQRIVSGSFDKTIKIWDVASGKALRTLAGHQGNVSSVAFSPDGQQIVSGSFDKTLKLWDTNSGKLLKTITGHNGKVRSVAFSPDGQRVAGADVTIKLWDVASGRELQSFSGHTKGVRKVVFSPDGDRIFSCSSDKTIKVWDVDSTVKVWDVTPSGDALAPKPAVTESAETLPPHSAHTKRVTCVAFSPDGRRIVSGSDDNMVKVWDVGDIEQK